MEELLNKLIEKGWKPFGYYDRMYLSDKSCVQYHKGKGMRSYFFVKGNGVGDNFTLRELVSKESGLWQFVCENGMVKEDDGHITRIINLYKSDETIVDGGWNYHYWLMICSILDESELEQFLLDNIKVE